MTTLHVLTPVKDSIDLTLQTIESVLASSSISPQQYTVYNDFSTLENTERLRKAADQYGFQLVNLSDITNHPSPNYLLILQMAQEKALKEDAGMCIVESDVIVKPDTLQGLYEGALQRPDCGIAASVTVDEEGVINYPYLYAKGRENQVYPVKKHVSFCCSLITPAFMSEFSFKQLDPSKSWHDVTISHQTVKMGYRNYLFTNLPVIHRPHGSRPWKQLKHTNPLKYYWRKFFTKKVN